MEVIQITKEQLIKYQSPMVYVFLKINKTMREDRKERVKYLYIGKSKHGLHRPFNPNHHLNNMIRKEANEMHLYICDTELEAIHLEIELIKQYHPKYNSQIITNKINFYNNRLRDAEYDAKNETKK